MSPHAESQGEGGQEPAAVEPAPRNEGRSSPGGDKDPPMVDVDNTGAPRDVPSEAGQHLGILFIAAAIGLALLLAIVGLLAVAAMSRTPPAPEEPRLLTAVPASPATPTMSLPA